MLALKRIKDLPLDLSEKLNLPGEVLPGIGSVSIVGGRAAHVEGHRGIIEYSEQRIVLAMSRGKITLSGGNMTLRAMNGGELLVQGKIQSVEWG